MMIEIVKGAAALSNVADEPCNVLVYAEPGFGKTTDAVKAMTVDGVCRAFFVSTEEGALKPALKLVADGLLKEMPHHTKTPVRSFEEVGQCFEFAASAGYSGVIVDSLSTLTNIVYPALEASMKGVKNKYEIPVRMRGYLSWLRDGARALGIHVIYVAHTSGPFVDDNKNFCKGGPLMVPRTAGHLFYPRLDTILRGAMLQVGTQAHRVYYTGGTEWPQGMGMPPNDWLWWWAKNREGCNDAIIPADLGAFLRARQPPYKGL